MTVNSKLRLVIYILVMTVCHQEYHNGHVPDHYYVFYNANDLPDSHQGNATMGCLFAADTKLSRVLSSIEYRCE